MNNSPTPPGESQGKIAPDIPKTTASQHENHFQYKYKLHWHVLLVHFPTAAFLGSFAFMVLHLFTQTTCFETSTYIILISGAVVMIPTTISGWITWKKKYKGAKGKIFNNKIRISFAMIAVSIIMVLYRTIFVTDVIDAFHNFWHYLFYAGGALLFLGAVAEGFFGGRLNHR
jgi:hypothetical protein